MQENRKESMIKLTKGKQPGYYHIYKDATRVGYVKVNDKSNVDMKINQEYRNKGYGTIALKKVASKYPQLNATIRKSNKASIRVAEKAGFKRISSKRQAIYRRK
jgi:RimJ/RimL family protein N-acetyltransferase